MNKLVSIAAVAVLAVSVTSGAQAGGMSFNKKTSNLLSNITGAVVDVTAKDIKILNGTTVAVGNNSNILSGINVGNGNLNGSLNGLLSGNGVLGIGGQNKKFGW